MTADDRTPCGRRPWVWPRRACALSLLLAACLAGRLSPAAVFTIDYTDASGEGFYDPLLGEQRRGAFEFALSIWQNRVAGWGSTTINVTASFDPMGGSRGEAVLGVGGPAAFIARFDDAPRADLAYPAPLANYLSGRNLNGSNADVDIGFNSDVDALALGSHRWYYGTDLRPAAGDVDFVTVALHELTHSLGFLSTFQEDGSFGRSAGPGGNLPTGFDYDLVNAAGTRLVNLQVRPSNVTGNVYWGGANGLAQYRQHFGSGRPAMHAPAIFEPDSSLSHLDEVVFTGSFDLMTPFASKPVHVPDAVTRGIMADIGWMVPGPGDVDANGVVDVADLLVVLDSLGRSLSGPVQWNGADVNADGRVDAADLGVAASHFAERDLLGVAPPRGASGYRIEGMYVSPGAARAVVYRAVPEPATIGLLAGLLAGGRFRRSGRRAA